MIFGTTLACWLSVNLSNMSLEESNMVRLQIVFFVCERERVYI